MVADQDNLETPIFQIAPFAAGFLEIIFIFQKHQNAPFGQFFRHDHKQTDPEEP